MKTIPLTQDRVALVDDEDYERLSTFNWYYEKDTNRARTGNGWTMSREVLQTEGLIDHKDGNPLNNQKSNLRICAQYQNQQNSKKHNYRGNPSSKYKGIYRREPSWCSRIYFQDIFGKTVCVHLGTFELEEDAGRAYDIAARRYHREFAALNFPGEGERSCL